MEPCTITLPATLEVEIAGMQVAHINVTIDQLDSMLAECSLLCCKQVAFAIGNTQVVTYCRHASGINSLIEIVLPTCRLQYIAEVYISLGYISLIAVLVTSLHI